MKNNKHIPPINPHQSLFAAKQVPNAIYILMTEARKKKTIWIQIRWNEEEIIYMNASKKDNQRIRISGKCNLPTLSREMGSISSLACSNAGINSGTRQQSAIRAKCASRTQEIDQEKLSASMTRWVLMCRSWQRLCVAYSLSSVITEIEINSESDLRCMYTTSRDNLICECLYSI